MKCLERRRPRHWHDLSIDGSPMRFNLFLQVAAPLPGPAIVVVAFLAAFGVWSLIARW